MSTSTPRLPPDMRQLLDGSGLPWRVETGTRHFKVMINDKFVTILPKSGTAHADNVRGHRNAMAFLRRAIREARGVIT